MAKRRGGGGEVVLLIIAAIVAAIAFAGPFVIAGWAIFTELRARRYRSATRARDVLEAAELSQFEHCETQLRTLEAEAARLDAQGIGMGLIHRADGGFDERNVKARGLNARLAEVQRRYMDARVEHDAVQQRLESKMSRWLRARSSVVGARAGLITFVIVFALAALNRSPGANTDGAFLGMDPGARLMVSLLATAAAGVAIWIGSSTARGSLAA